MFKRKKKLILTLTFVIIIILEPLSVGAQQLTTDNQPLIISDEADMSKKDIKENEKIPPPNQGQRTKNDEPNQKQVLSSEEKVLFDLRGINIADFFKLISLKTGFTIVPTNKVSGKVNLFIHNVTPEEALHIVLKIYSLAIEIRDNLFYVMTQNEYKTLYGREYRDDRELLVLDIKYASPSTLKNFLAEIKSSIGEISVDPASGTIFIMDLPENLKLIKETFWQLDRPLDTLTYNLRYARTEEIKKKIESELTKGVGKLQIDERTNRIIVTDFSGRINKISRIITSLDIPLKEILMDVKVCQIALTNEHQRGVEWETILSEKAEGGLDLKGTFPAKPSFQTLEDISTANLKLQFGNIPEDKLAGVLRLLEAYGEANIITSSKIMSKDNQEAQIKVIDKTPYISQTQSQSGGSTVTSESVEFIDIGVTLNVTPQLNENNFITIKIKPEISSVREILTTALGSTIPLVELAEVETMVKVKDGSTVMIGGLIREEKQKNRTGIPVLSKLPFLGAVFGSNAGREKRTELIIFITPRVVNLS
ncbi:MAG: secretin N-terminal domain-containing protein [bacterium]